MWWKKKKTVVDTKESLVKELKNLDLMISEYEDKLKELTIDEEKYS